LQISIVNGIYTDNAPGIRVLYPTNLTPVYEDNGVSAGFLKPSDGMVETATGPGVDRGGIIWNGIHYRVMGSSFVQVSDDGTVITTLGDVGHDGVPVTMDYSFDYLAITSNKDVFYWDGTTLQQITDPDLGEIIDHTFVDGYFMFNDGEFLIVNDLADPTQISPDAYGTAETDPDGIKCLIKVRNEVHAVGRHTIEAFRTTTGGAFPFGPVRGSQITKGTYGPHSACLFNDAIAFVGSDKYEPPGVFIGVNGSFTKISTREIDEVLKTYTDGQLSKVVLEKRLDRSSDMLYMHLPEVTYVYDLNSSKAEGRSIWHQLKSGVNPPGKYRARFPIYHAGKWWVGDPDSSKIGYFTDSLSTHWGEKSKWEFGTPIVYNGGDGAVFSELELVALTGRVELGKDPIISTSYTRDGLIWSQDSTIRAGKVGERNKRLVWRRQGMMRSIRMQRFQGDSDTHLSFLRLEADLDPLGA
jgi:hypothetical protein